MRLKKKERKKVFLAPEGYGNRNALRATVIFDAENRPEKKDKRTSQGRRR